MIESVAGSGIFFAGFRGERRVVNGMKTQKPLKGASHMKSSGKAEITKRKADTGAKRLRATIAAMSLVALALSLSNARAQDNPGVPTQGIDPATGLPVKNPDFPNAGLFVLREARPTPETERIVEAFNIGPYLEWMAANHENWGLNPSKPEEKRKIREQSRAA